MGNPITILEGLAGTSRYTRVPLWVCTNLENRLGLRKLRGTANQVIAARQIRCLLIFGVLKREGQAAIATLTRIKRVRTAIFYLITWKSQPHTSAGVQAALSSAIGSKLKRRA